MNASMISLLDAEKRREAETQVKDWREKSKLPFPEFDGKDQLEIENKLDYPPTGSSHHQPRKGVPEVEKSRKTTQSK